MIFPKSFKQITLQTYAAADTILKNDSLDAGEKDLHLLALLAGKPLDAILALTLRERAEYLAGLRFLNRPDSLLKTGSKKKPLILRSFWLKRCRYRIILDARELSGGQYIDLMNYLKNPDEMIVNIHNILAVIAMPLRFGVFKKPYSGCSHPARAEFLYRNMTVAMAWPVLVFFCNLFRCLIPDTANYLSAEIRKQVNLAQQQAAPFMNVTAG